MRLENEDGLRDGLTELVSRFLDLPIGSMEATPDYVPKYLIEDTLGVYSAAMELRELVKIGDEQPEEINEKIDFLYERLLDRYLNWPELQSRLHFSWLYAKSLVWLTHAEFLLPYLSEKDEVIENNFKYANCFGVILLIEAQTKIERRIPEIIELVVGGLYNSGFKDLAERVMTETYDDPQFFYVPAGNTKPFRGKIPRSPGDSSLN